MSKLGYINPLDFDIKRLKKIAQENGQLAFSTNQKDWLTEQTSPEEFALKAAAAIIQSINGSLEILVNEQDYYLLGNL